MSDKLAQALREAIHQAIALDGLREEAIGPQHWVSIARTALAEYEAAKAEPPDEFIDAIADAVGCWSEPRGSLREFARAVIAAHEKKRGVK